MNSMDGHVVNQILMKCLCANVLLLSSFAIYQHKK
ncbi:hypothetical protein VIBHAR_05808 [Vibrio campbellii ATCC BAA-1116]|uniref:Uncharacterized protein n=1 Tax=Vibrio campbellii (strain ATCC BAA-1116) TaxID=2902295 RepID=A7N4Y8_VIBC1|nr:hypothetical protein VIBHAR_05808 [Vibrio campbellii ATCC BAA-1116]